jgi:PST family polysaccharide transporter
MTVFRRIASNSSWWLAEKLGLMALSLGANIVVVRALGPAGYGELSYLLALVGLVAPLSQLGVSGLVARALLEKPTDEAAVLRAAMLIRLVGSAVALLAGLAYWAFVEQQTASRWVLLVLLAAQFASVLQVVEFWFQVRYRATALVPWRAGVLLLGAAVKVTVAVTTQDPRLVALAFALETLLLGVAYSIALHRASGFRLHLGPSPEWVRWFVRRAPWLFASGMAEVIYLRIDVVLLERLRGVEEAGIYAVASRLSEVWYMVPVVLMASVFPALWERRPDPVAYRRSLQASLDVLAGMAFALAIVIQLVGAPLLTTLFGSQYARSVPVLEIHIWAGVFIFMRALLSRWLLAEDLLHFSLITHLSGAAMNVALNLLLIPSFGAVGSATATVISYACASWLSLFLFHRTRPMGLMMAKALLIPFRWGAIGGYARRLRTDLLRRAS